MKVMADKGIIKMNINSLSKYIIIFLFAVLVVLAILLMFYSAQNKRLERENVRLKEMVELRDAAITEIDKNIAALQQQVLEAESICNERLKARENLLTFLSIEPAYDVGKNGTFFPQLPACAVSDSSLLGRETGSRRWETLPSEINLHNGSKKGSVAPPATELTKNNIDSSPMGLATFSDSVATRSGKSVLAKNARQSDMVGVYEVISKNKSDYAVNAINNYWVQFTQRGDSKK